MNRTKKTTWLVAAVGPVCLVLLTASASASDVLWTEDNFYITLIDEDTLHEGGGSGYPPEDPGQWFYYPETGWWRQWFYNDPFATEPWYGEIEIVLMAGNTQCDLYSSVEIAASWSTPAWSLEGNPPSDPREPPRPGIDEGLYIHCEEPFFTKEAPGNPEGPCWISSMLWPEYYSEDHYNPEWVGIAVKGCNVWVNPGSIRHRCVPEPATVSLLAFGAFGVLRHRRQQPRLRHRNH